MKLPQKPMNVYEQHVIGRRINWNLLKSAGGETKLRERSSGGNRKFDPFSCIFLQTYPVNFFKKLKDWVVVHCLFLQ